MLYWFHQEKKGGSHMTNSFDNLYSPLACAYIRSSVKPRALTSSQICAKRCLAPPMS